MPLIPICDILLVETRRCKHCGSVSTACSPVRHRLYRAPIGELDKIVITVPPVGEALAGPYAEAITRKEVAVDIPHCDQCWQADVDFEEVLRYRPDRPLPERHYPVNGGNGALAARIDQRPPARLEDL